MGRGTRCQQREEEEKKSNENAVADWAIYQFQSLGEVTPALKRRLCLEGIDRFRGRVPGARVILLIEATIRQEQARQYEIAAYRAAEARKKAARSAQRKSMLSLPALVEGEGHAPAGSTGS